MVGIYILQLFGLTYGSEYRHARKMAGMIQAHIMPAVE